MINNVHAHGHGIALHGVGENRNLVSVGYSK